MRYWKWVRRMLIWVSDHVPEAIEDRILKYLYPDDMMIHFNTKSHERSK